MRTGVKWGERVIHGLEWHNPGLVRARKHFAQGSTLRGTKPEVASTTVAVATGPSLLS